MADELGYGVIGCGVIGPVHAEVISGSERARLVGVCDIREDRARALVERFGPADIYGDYRELLECGEIDAVSICTPHYLHVEMIEAAAAKGKHVLVEKPLAINEEEADRAIEACREAGVKLEVCLQNRLNSSVLSLKKAIDDGLLGSIKTAFADVSWYRTSSYYADSDWRGRYATEGGGVLINQAIHTLDLLLHLVGDVTEVSARAVNVAHEGIEVEDVVAAALGFEGGAEGAIYATTCHYGGDSIRLSVSGDRGSAVIVGDELVSFRNADGDEPPTGRSHCSGPLVQSKSYYGTSHGLLIDDFISSVLQDRQPFVSGEEGRRCVKLVQDIYRASREGRCIRG